MANMAVSQQVALTRPRSIGPSSNISNVTRQIVPPFLQKLYEMVNNPNNEELIRWSEAGDSFFVLDHERFANEVLGRWFKHRNFSSFVRQLNMYGFHKIPHLQQGVLKSDADKEFWNFAHASFKRGQPDLLCLIQRKKQGNQQDDVAGVPSPMDVRVEPDGRPQAAAPSVNGGVITATPTTGGALTLSTGQVLDIQSIVNGIAAIKRHQTTISAELNELKKNNQMLWQEANAARNRHQKQQDTINKIVRFLAGMFGNHTDTSPKHARVVNVTDDQEGVMSMGMGMDIEREQNAGHFMPRRQRLMIEAARRDAEDAEMSGEPTVETPLSAPSPAPSTTDSISIVDQTSQFGDSAQHLDNSIHDDIANPQAIVSNDATSPAASSTPTPSSDSLTVSDLFTPSHSSPASSVTLSSTAVSSPIPTTTENRLLSPRLISRPSSAQQRAELPIDWENNPALRNLFDGLSQQQLQAFVASFNNYPVQDPSASTSGQMTTYQPPMFDFQASPSTVFQNFPSFDAADGSSSSTAATVPAPIPIAASTEPELPPDLIPFDDPGKLDKVERQWQVAEDIDKDVSALDNGITQLMSIFGLQPDQSLEGMFAEDLSAGAGSSNGVSGQPDHSGDVNMNGFSEPHLQETNEFDLDSFLNTISSGQDGQEEESAFLDEMPVPQAGSAAKGKKRKSDVTEEIRAIQKDNNASRAAVAGVGGIGAQVNGSAGASASARVTVTGNGAEKRRKIQEGE